MTTAVAGPRAYIHGSRSHLALSTTTAPNRTRRVMPVHSYSAAPRNRTVFKRLLMWRIAIAASTSIETQRTMVGAGLSSPRLIVLDGGLALFDSAHAVQEVVARFEGAGMQEPVLL